MRTNKNIFITILLLFSTCFSCLALTPSTSESQNLIVWLKSGEKVRYNLEESPKTTFTQTSIVIETNSIKVDYSLNQVIKYTYEKTTTDVKSSKMDEMIVSQEGNNLIFNNLKKGSTIQIYSLDGTLLETKNSNTNSTIISLSNYPNNVYLVKINNTTYKIIKQ